jgi:hypothetical protein
MSMPFMSWKSGSCFGIKSLSPFIEAPGLEGRITMELASDTQSLVRRGLEHEDLND